MIFITHHFERVKKEGRDKIVCDENTKRERNVKYNL